VHPPGGLGSSNAGDLAERRIPALDGFRGLMTIAVVVSHYFGEVPHGFAAVSFGWIAVDCFFVLSGYLIANLILDKMDRANFFSVFYVRRFCRTLPCYFLCVCFPRLPNANGPMWVPGFRSGPTWRCPRTST
jgi:peptidoglycan/LPS O-acetylase OafA/YrhL